MDESMKWFVGAESAYEGEYVAIGRQQVLAHGEDPEEIYDAAKAMCPGEKVVLHKVMPAGNYLFTHRDRPRDRRVSVPARS